MAYTPPLSVNLNNLGSVTVIREVIWRDLAMRAWGSEWQAPDKNVYQFSNGRGFDSTDRNANGIYNGGIITDGFIIVDGQRYGDVYIGNLLTENGNTLIQES